MSTTLESVKSIFRARDEKQSSDRLANIEHVRKLLLDVRNDRKVADAKLADALDSIGASPQWAERALDAMNNRAEATKLRESQNSLQSQFDEKRARVKQLRAGEAKRNREFTHVTRRYRSDFDNQYLAGVTLEDVREYRRLEMERMLEIDEAHLLYRETESLKTEIAKVESRADSLDPGIDPQSRVAEPGNAKLPPIS